MTKVQEIMQREVFRLFPETPLAPAAHALEQQFMGGAPVCDADGHVLGVLSRSDLIEVDERRRSHGTVGDLMVHDVVSAAPSAPAIDVVRQMLAHGVHRVVVLDGEGKLVGLVTTMDVLRAIANGASFT